MAAYGTPTAPTALKGFMVEPQARVLLGTGGSSDLETTSWPASTYSAPIGLASGAGIELGALDDLSFSVTPTVEPTEAANFENALFYEVSGEECEVSVTLKEWKPQVIKEAVSTGVLYFLGAEALLTFGGGCATNEMPLVIEFTNKSCQAPSSADIGSGVTGGILTLYKVFPTSGIDFGALSAKEKSSLTLTFRAIHDTDKAAGNQLGNLYLY